MVLIFITPHRWQHYKTDTLALECAPAHITVTNFERALIICFNRYRASSRAASIHKCENHALKMCVGSNSRQPFWSKRPNGKVLLYSDQRRRTWKGVRVNPELQNLSVQLGEAVVRNTASAIAHRVTAAKAKKRDTETIAELEDIISGLISDKGELVRIAQAYEQELVAQKISAKDVEYISKHVVPVIQDIAIKSGQDKESVQSIVDLIKPVLSVEMVTILQLIGFNFRAAMGQPLTNLLAQLIQSQMPIDNQTSVELQRLQLERENRYLRLAEDAEAFDRLRQLRQQ